MLGVAVGEGWWQDKIEQHPKEQGIKSMLESLASCESMESLSLDQPSLRSKVLTEISAPTTSCRREAWTFLKVSRSSGELGCGPRPSNRWFIVEAKTGLSPRYGRGFDPQPAGS